MEGHGDERQPLCATSGRGESVRERRVPLTNDCNGVDSERRE